MGIVTIDEKHLFDIGDVIREKGGRSGGIQPRYMASEFSDIVDEKQAVVDSIFEKTITEIHSNATSIGKYMFADCQNLITADFPLATNMGEHSFSGCINLSNINFPLIGMVSKYAFQKCDSLESVVFPSAHTIAASAFIYSANLKMVDLHCATTIAANCFKTCQNLTTFILRSNTRADMTLANALNGTPIESGSGYIYVPSSLVNEYKSATNWSMYADKIRAIEDYPEITGG